MKVCFVILHYMSEQVTEMCVSSLLKLDDIEECGILVYDNGSNNGSFEKLKNEFQKAKNVFWKKSTQNLGFSEGNNRAYKVARGYSPKFIAFLNNDIEIKQKKFVSILDKEYKNNDFPYIIGPDIYNPRMKEHQSPMSKDIITLDEVKERIKNEENRINKVDKILETYKHAAKMRKIKRYVPTTLLEIRDKVLHKEVNTLYKNKKLENAVLQGSCIIATEKYISQEDVMFEPDTTFYAEELLLALKCKTLRYNTLYTSRLHVIHRHGMSSGFNDIPSIDALKTKGKRLIHAYSIYERTLVDNPWKDHRN